MITYHKLTPDEFPKIKKLFKKYGDPLPNQSTIFVAKDGSDIVGWIVYEQIVHCGPTRTLEGYQRQGIRLGLAKFSESLMPPNAVYYSFPKNEAAKAFCKKNGSISLGFEVWQKILDKEK